MIQPPRYTGGGRGCPNRGQHKHGMHHWPEYAVWAAMLMRCYNSKDRRYVDYGGRGIVVCDSWQGNDGFLSFITDMGQRPGRNYQLDRIDNNGPYDRNNCRWATRREQQCNRRTNVLLTYKGRMQCIAAWAEELNMLYSTLYYRMKRGWSVKRALTTPV